MSENSSEKKSLKNLILVVDHDKIILESFKKILELEGFGVDTAESGKQALEKISNGHFHLALVDDGLSDMTPQDLRAKTSMSDIKVFGLGMKLIDPRKLIETIRAFC